MKRLLNMILLFLFLAAGTAVSESEPDLTLMVYLCGSDLETEAGAASADLAEMIEHYPADGSLRVIVMPSGSREWKNEISAEETAIYELTNAGLEKLCALPLQSMGDPAALTALLEYGYTYAPARRHALLMWDHGAGPNIGLCFDELFQTENSMDGLTLEELSAALSSSPAAQNKLSWIGFDACLMASLETACTVAPYAHYMIASQETEPASGWDYSFLAHAAKDPSGAATGQRVIDGYFQSLADSMAPHTLSCVSLSDMPAISTTLNQLFNDLHLSLNEHSYPAFAECRVLTKSPGYSTGYEYDLVDLADLLQLYQEEGLADCSVLLEQLDQAIVESRSNMPFINGLSICFPHYGTQEEVSFPAFEGYAAFIADMSAIRLGKPLTDWSETHRPEAAVDNGVTQVTMTLTPSQAATLDSATLFIIKQMSGSDFQLVYRTNDVSLSDGNVLSAVYEEQALFIVNAQGEAVSTALPYSLQGDTVVLSCMLEKDTENLPEDAEWFTFARCLFRKDEQGRYRLSEVQENTGDPTQQGKATLRLEDYATISIFQGSSVPAYAEDGKLLPPAQWAKGDMTYGWWFDLADHPGWSVDFLSQQDDRSRYALLQITDTQNHVVCSDLVPVPNPNLIELPVTQQTLINTPECRIRFTGAQQILGVEPMLRLHFACENPGVQNIHAAVGMLQFDDTVLSGYSVASPSLDPGESNSFEIDISRNTLESLGIQSVEKIYMDLSVSHDYTNIFLEQSAVIDFAADLTQIAPAPVQHEVLSSVSLNGMELSLYDLACSNEAHLTGKLSIRNTSDAAITLDATAFYLNDLQLQGYLTDAFYNTKLLPGAICHTGFQVNLQAYSFDHYRPESARFLLGALGITHLNTLDITLYDAETKQYARAAFTLPQPLALPVDEEAKRADGWPILYDQDGVTIRLADFTWAPGIEYQAQYRYVNLLVENASAFDISIQVPQRTTVDDSPSFLVNGRSPSFVYSPVAPANTITMQTMWYPAAEGYETMEQLDMQLHITDGNGRSDLIRVSVTAPAEGRADGDYRILDAAELLVTVAPIN